MKPKNITIATLEDLNNRVFALERQQEAQERDIEKLKEGVHFTSNFEVGNLTAYCSCKEPNVMTLDNEPLEACQTCGKFLKPSQGVREEMIERIRRVMKEIMGGLPAVEVIRENIDMCLDEISRYYDKLQ
jgi:hypothetical protein